MNHPFLNGWMNYVNFMIVNEWEIMVEYLVVSPIERVWRDHNMRMMRLSCGYLVIRCVVLFLFCVYEECDKFYKQMPNWSSILIRITKMSPKTRKTPQGAMPTSQEELDQLIAEKIASALARYEAKRAEPSGGSGGLGGTNPEPRRERSTSGTDNPPAGCTFKMFLDCKPLNFSGTEGSVGLLK